MLTQSVTILESVLELVYIPGGSFVMGAPAEDSPAWDAHPQHEVTLQAFWMSKYPITQAQWRSVASLPKVKVSLDPDPSAFKGDNRPVETLSWYEAMEFCKRLSVYTKDVYTLPSEAQWEYSCRGATTTPFYFGETISPDQANYNGHYTYGAGLQGIYREETTDVGSFSANNFGLYDMHGNVWEWCLDQFHDSYKGAPVNGSAWMTGGNSSYRMVRGGSWFSVPWFCRCAFRNDYVPVSRNNHVGFRIIRPTAASRG
jgi:formylglycine-generating enzyme required for sulfatase activity